MVARICLKTSIVDLAFSVYCPAAVASLKRHLAALLEYEFNGRTLAPYLEHQSRAAWTFREHRPVSGLTTLSCIDHSANIFFLGQSKEQLSNPNLQIRRLNEERWAFAALGAFLFGHVPWPAQWDATPLTMREIQLDPVLACVQGFTPDLQGELRSFSWTHDPEMWTG